VQALPVCGRLTSQWDGRPRGRSAGQPSWTVLSDDSNPERQVKVTHNGRHEGMGGIRGFGIEAKRSSQLVLAMMTNLRQDPTKLQHHTTLREAARLRLCEKAIQHYHIMAFRLVCEYSSSLLNN
jgi:hypothetical protein